MRLRLLQVLLIGLLLGGAACGGGGSAPAPAENVNSETPAQPEVPQTSVPEPTSDAGTSPSPAAAGDTDVPTATALDDTGDETTDTAAADNVTPPPVDPCATLDDGDACTVDACTDGTVTHIAMNTDDGDACTTDSCVNGDEVHTPIAVDDGNACTTDACVEGVVAHAPVADGTACNDGESCSTQDLCRGGQCVGYANCSALSAVWANDGGDKVAQQEMRASADPAAVANLHWSRGDATHPDRILLFGARNETVSFSLLLEAATGAVPAVSVRLTQLVGPDSATITTVPASGDNVFKWVGRNIELFYVRYLPIQGLSYFGYPTYDERLIPQALQRPWHMEGTFAQGDGGWTDRPQHDAAYPDIAVPLELVPTFTVAKNTSQAIWVDLYIPKAAPAGLYTGIVDILESGVVKKQVPVELTVRNFALPDVPNAKTMLFLGYGDINERYLGLSKRFPNVGPDDEQSDLIRNRHFLLAHRHKISLIDANDSAESWPGDAPRPEWITRLDGTLFSAANGYDGPGVGVGNGVFSIGTYHSWYGANWDEESEMRAHSNAWVDWFKANVPTAEYFLYLIDESSNTDAIEQWATWLAENPGTGKALRSLATIPLPTAVNSTPHLQIPTTTLGVGDTAVWNSALTSLRTDAAKRFFMYNGQRPAAGSFVTDDDGVALRATAWAQYKRNIDRWFYWESTYYYDPQSCGERVDLFANAKTIGCDDGFDSVRGRTGYQYTNGDGVLFYPGTDTIYPASSYGLAGPLASLRLKHWRRGIQDVDYLTLAAQNNPAAVVQIVQQIVPKVLWEYGVQNQSDPTYVHTALSWSTDPDVWEQARKQLADIIEAGPP